jgi:radical SAM/Cys-rich protein
MMTRETMEHCLRVLGETPVATVDITGGAPEMHPDFRWFVRTLRQMGKHVIARCNLTIIVANRKFNDLPEFYRDHQVEIASSLPFYSAQRTDRQRGEGVFDSSIRALKMLNHVGYGQPGSNLILNLVYNPSGAFLPANQEQMEKDFKAELKRNYNVDFNRLFCITNMPVSRFLEYLLNSGNYERYMERLLLAFNPNAAKNVMCRNTLSVGWDGSLYDCDFNQMLDMKLLRPGTIADLKLEQVENRPIRTNQHCFGCTAGTGSSCSGSIA